MDQCRRDDDWSLNYLWPCDAARLKEFMSPSGADEMPFRHMVPIMGSAPRSRSKLTSSKLPENKPATISIRSPQYFYSTVSNQICLSELKISTRRITDSESTYLNINWALFERMSVTERGWVSTINKRSYFPPSGLYRSNDLQSNYENNHLMSRLCVQAKLSKDVKTWM